MRILYITWGEVPRMSSVYGGQVVRVVSALQREQVVEKVKLLAGYPIVHSGLIREKHNYWKQLEAIRNLLGPDNFLTRRLPVLPVGIYPNEWQLPSFFVHQESYMKELLGTFDPQIVHCRSYLSALFAIRLRNRFDLKYKVIFDARSLLPEEAAISGRWSFDSSVFQMWKSLENEILQNADLTLSVSIPMQAWFDKIGAKKSGLVYLNVDTNVVDPAEMNNISRLEAGRPILVYAGSLSEGSWHDPLQIWRIFSSFREFVPGAELRIITKSNHFRLKENLIKNGFGKLLQSISFTSAESPSQTLEKLQSSDIAIFGYHEPKGSRALEMAEAVFATKTAEYLCSGLPVIVNKVCGGARDYVLNRGFGVAYESDTLLCRDDIDRLIQLSRNRLEISNVSRDDFSVYRNAGRLVEMYSLLS